MESLFVSFTKAIRSLFAPGMFGIFIASVIVTIFALGGFIFLTTMAANWWFAGDEDSYFQVFGSFIFSVLLAWFLFPGIMPIIVNFFDVKIARSIEAQDYPASQPLAEPLFWPEFWHDVRFSLFAITLNIMVLPLYFVPLVNAVLFYVLNGYLLGREFFIMVARRHIALEEAKKLRKNYARYAFLAGVALAFCATIPILNLFAPFWGIAVMTHLYHALQKTPKAQVLPPN